MQKVCFQLLFLTLLMPLAVFAQNPAKWMLDSDAKGTQLKMDESFRATLKADIDSGWHLYALDQPPGGPVATTIKTPEGSPFSIGKKIDFPSPQTKPDPNFIVDGKPLETKFFIDHVEFGVVVQALQDVAADSVAIDVRFQLCNDQFCLPPKTVRVSFAGSEEISQRPAVGSQQPGENRIAADNRQPTTSDRSFGVYLASRDAWGSFAFDAVRFSDDPDHGFVFYEPLVREPFESGAAGHSLFGRDNSDIHAAGDAAGDICRGGRDKSFCG